MVSSVVKSVDEGGGKLVASSESDDRESCSLLEGETCSYTFANSASVKANTAKSMSSW
jgi:hypothetical protein